MTNRHFYVSLEVEVRVRIHDWDRFYERCREYGATTPAEAAELFARVAVDTDRRTTDRIDGWADLEGVAEIYGPDVRDTIDSWEMT